MGTHVDFDGTNKIIVVHDGVDEFDIQEVYSEWKEWMCESDNAKYIQAMRTVGGDPTTGEKSVAPYFFLCNGWKIRPHNGDHYLTINGNLFVDEPETYGYQPVVHTLTEDMVTVSMNLTSDAIGIQTGGSSGPSATEVAAAVWNRLLASHTTEGSAGKTLADLAEVEGGDTWEGNIAREFIVADSAIPARNVAIGRLSHEILKVKADADPDWSNPISTKTLYFWYKQMGDVNPQYVKGISA